MLGGNCNWPGKTAGCYAADRVKETGRQPEEISNAMVEVGDPLISMPGGGG